jgi:hypothetical protein
MNKTHTNDPADRILAAAMEAVARTADLKIGKEPAQAAADRARGQARNPVVAFVHEGRKFRYAAEIRTIDRAAGLALVKARMEKCGQPWLLAAPYITAEMADQCRAMGVQFIDAAGNAYLKARGLHIYITGRKRALKDAPAAKDRATTATGMRVVFALLCRPELLNAPYRDIAAAAGVALGTVGWALFALQDRGHLLADKLRGRGFTDKKRLTEEWALNYPVRLRPRLGARRFQAPRPDWWKTARLEKNAALLGGEAAGELLTDYRKAGEAVVYAAGDPTRLIIDNRLKADPAGTVEILEKFWNFDIGHGGGRTVPPLLVYADLMAARDPRDHELAKLVYERYLANAED